MLNSWLCCGGTVVALHARECPSAPHFFFSSGAPAAWRSSRRPCLRSRVALFLARRDSYWSAIDFSRACGARAWREHRRAPASVEHALRTNLLGLGLVDVLHQNALVLEHVALHLHSARRVRPVPLARRRARRACLQVHLVVHVLVDLLGVAVPAHPRVSSRRRRRSARARRGGAGGRRPGLRQQGFRGRGARTC